VSELTPAAARACLVESIPVGLEDLRGTPGVQYTEDALVRLTRTARSTIDLTTMYWALATTRRALRTRNSRRWALAPAAPFTRPCGMPPPAA
jgi:hypothetical protein